MKRVKIDVVLDQAADKLESQLVKASSLTRILRMIGHDDRVQNDIDVKKPFAILTAFRSDLSSGANTLRLQQMAEILARAQIKTFELKGHWLEAPEGMTFDEAEIAQKLIHIEEQSLFAVPKRDVEMDFETFQGAVTRQADRYDQDAIIMSNGETVWLRFKDGHMKSLGDRIQVDVLENAYKAMRGQKEHPFVFAATIVEDKPMRASNVNIDLSDTEYGYVEAKGLSRLLRMLGEPRQEPEDPTKPADPKTNPNKIKVQTTRPFAILTAWRDVFDVKENRARNADLLKRLNEKKMGAYKLVGYFQNPPEGMTYDEAREAGKLGQASKEESFLVVMPNEGFDVQGFEALISQWALQDYEQWAFILGDGQAVYEVSKQGRRKLGSKVTMPLIQQAYSLMRNHEDKPFVFAGTITPSDMGMMRWFAAEGLAFVTPPTPAQRKLMARLQELVISAMKFREFKSHGGTSKMWIDPKNRPIPLDGMHYEWLRDNAAFIRKAFNLPNMPEFGLKDEGPARLWALMNGFTRVNYKPQNGEVVFDTCEKFWTPKRQDVVSMIIAENADEIDHIVVNVYSDDGKRLVRDGAQDVSGLDDAAAKVEAAPHMNLKRTKLIAECLRRFGM